MRGAISDRRGSGYSPRCARSVRPPDRVGGRDSEVVLCGVSKRGRCGANQSRNFGAGLHTMYVDAFAGAIAPVLDKGQSVSGRLCRVA